MGTVNKKPSCSCPTTCTTPPIELTGAVQVEDIRDMLYDAIPSDCPVALNDFFFSDEEIVDAARRCVEAFNDTEPINIKIGYVAFANNYRETYKLGIAWQAYRTKYLNFIRKSNPYTAGEVAVDTYGNQAKYAKAIADEFKSEFIPKVLKIKRTININNCWGSIG